MPSDEHGRRTSRRRLLYLLGASTLSLGGCSSLPDEDPDYRQKWQATVDTTDFVQEARLYLYTDDLHEPSGYLELLLYEDLSTWPSVGSFTLPNGRNTQYEISLGDREVLCSVNEESLSTTGTSRCEYVLIKENGDVLERGGVVLQSTNQCVENTPWDNGGYDDQREVVDCPPQVEQ